MTGDLPTWYNLVLPFTWVWLMESSLIGVFVYTIQ